LREAKQRKSLLGDLTDESGKDRKAAADA